MTYPKATLSALQAASNTEADRQTMVHRALLTLADREWVSGWELAGEAGLRFNARLFEARHDLGVEWECRVIPNRKNRKSMAHEYRLLTVEDMTERQAVA